MPETFRVGLLGHGTVGSAFAALLEQRADAIVPGHRAAPGAQRRAHALARRLRGDPRRLGPDRRADGRRRARRATTCCARCGRASTSSPPTSSCSPSTARSCGRARASTACSCASRPRSPASCPSSACCRSRSPPRTSSASTGSSTGRRTTSSPRWRAAGSPTTQALAQAQQLGYAEADPTDDVTGRDAAAKMAILARLAFDTPVHLDQVRYEGIEHITRRRHRLRAAARARAEADRDGRARRRRASACACTPRSSTPGHPLASVNGPFNAVTVESDAITEITMSGPGRGRPADRLAPCSAT